MIETNSIISMGASEKNFITGKKIRKKFPDFKNSQMQGKMIYNFLLPYYW